MQRAAKPKREPQASLEAPDVFVTLLRTPTPWPAAPRPCSSPTTFPERSTIFFASCAAPVKRACLPRKSAAGSSRCRSGHHSPARSHGVTRMDRPARAGSKKTVAWFVTRIARKGSGFLAISISPCTNCNRRQLRHLPATQLRQLSHLLDRARGLLDGPCPAD